MESDKPRSTHPGAMMVAFTFQAKPGREKEFEAMLDNKDMALVVAKAIGATRNTLFLANGRMVRVLEFPDGVKPRTLQEVAREDERIASFLRKLGPMVEGGFDYDDPSSFQEFNARVLLPLTYDVRVE